MKLSIFYSIVFSFLIFNLANGDEVYDIFGDIVKDKSTSSYCRELIHQRVEEAKSKWGWGDEVYIDIFGDIVEDKSISSDCCRKGIHQRTDTNTYLADGYIGEEKPIIYPCCDIYEGIYAIGDNLYMDANGNIVDDESITPSYCRQEIDQKTQEGVKHKRVL